MKWKPDNLLNRLATMKASDVKLYHFLTNICFSLGLLNGICLAFLMFTYLGVF